jgi:hypothetical protein
MTLSAGATLGPYRIVELLDAGGMGARVPYPGACS